MLAGRNLDKLTSVAKELDAGPRVLPISVNSIVQDEVDGIFSQAREHFGRVDFLINAAGTMGVGPIGTLSSSDWWQNFVSPAPFLWWLDYETDYVASATGG